MPDYPFLNGHRYSWSSIENQLNGLGVRGLASLDYDDGLDPGEMRGQGVAVNGRTRGKYEPSASFEMYREEFDELVADLGGNGYMERSFTWNVQYAEENNEVVTDTIEGCRIKKVSNSAAEGNDPQKVKCELSVIRVLRNGYCGYDAGRP